MKLVRQKLVGVWVMCLVLLSSPAHALDVQFDTAILESMWGVASSVSLVIGGFLLIALSLVAVGFILGIVTGMEYQSGFRALKNRRW